MWSVNAQLIHIYNATSKSAQVIAKVHLENVKLRIAFDVKKVTGHKTESDAWLTNISYESSGNIEWSSADYGALDENNGYVVVATYLMALSHCLSLFVGLSCWCFRFAFAFSCPANSTQGDKKDLIF